MDFPTLYKSTILGLTLLFTPYAIGSKLGAQRERSATHSSTMIKEIEDAARRASLDPKLVRAMVRVESNYLNEAVSPKGAMGLMQVRRKTANESQIQAPFHALNNLMGGCEYLRKLINRYKGDLSLALAAYNAGPTNVDKYQGVPPFPETQAYVHKVLALYKQFQNSFQSTGKSP